MSVRAPKPFTATIIMNSPSWEVVEKEASAQVVIKEVRNTLDFVAQHTQSAINLETLSGTCTFNVHTDEEVLLQLTKFPSDSDTIVSQIPCRTTSAASKRILVRHSQQFIFGLA
jgi:hypothetical protein